MDRIIICSEILLLNSFDKKKHFSQIFSISVKELCQVLIRKAGNKFCPSKVISRSWNWTFFKTKLNKPSNADKKYFCYPIGWLAEFLQISDEIWYRLVLWGEILVFAVQCWGRDKHLNNLCLAVLWYQYSLTGWLAGRSDSLCRPVSDLTRRVGVFSYFCGFQNILDFPFYS